MGVSESDHHQICTIRFGILNKNPPPGDWFFRKSCNRILTSSPISARGELFEHSYIEHAPSFEDLSRKKRNGFDQNDSKKMCESERVKIPSIFVFNCVNLLGYSKHPRRVMECARIRLLVAEPREKKTKNNETWVQTTQTKSNRRPPIVKPSTWRPTYMNNSSDFIPLAEELYTYSHADNGRVRVRSKSRNNTQNKWWICSSI